MLPAVLPGEHLRGQRRQAVDPSSAAFSIQPGEFAKLALLSFFAYYLVRKREVLSLASRRFLGIDFPRGRDLGPVVVVWLLSLLVLVFEKDLGTSLLYFGMFVVTLYIATERVSWLIIGLLLFFGGATSPTCSARRSAARSPTSTQRVEIWLDPFADAVRRAATSWSSRCSAWAPAACSAPGRAAGSAATPGARGAQRLHLRRHRRGDRPVRAHRAAGRSTC